MKYLKDIPGEFRYFLKVLFDTKDKIGYQERDINLEFVFTTNDSLIINMQIPFQGIVKASRANK